MYLRFILLDISFKLLFVNWKEGCLSSSSCIIINGLSYRFLTSFRGLKKGFPSSPLFFLIIVEILSRILGAYKSRGILKSINIDDVSITHLLYVDVVLFFCVCFLREVEYMKIYLKLFGVETRIEVNF